MRTAIDVSIVWPALAAGLLVTITHVALGIQVLKRGIVFIDLAIAQIAGLGVVFANWVTPEAQGWVVQLCALGAALAGALLLTWTERRWPEVQEALIGVVFVLASTGVLLLLAAHPHGGEHLRGLLLGQILWVNSTQLALVAAAYALLLPIILRFERTVNRSIFYLVFACVVTISVQLVGLYLVFTTLIVPALATRRMAHYRIVAGCALSAAGYGVGLLLSALVDLPAGPAIVWSMTLLAIPLFASSGRVQRAQRHEC